ncbi:hypothetical protein CEXT_370171 [Caerostris extrusa]|uniref:Uncharacterized protein n=1 Tax=Caerostris extrusa TaxID=172846 RepID=A0AAV4NEP7_CAEEX|nr:hypothetical protein CEXT_370171 [Caerostris extrusa]
MVSLNMADSEDDSFEGICRSTSKVKLPERRRTGSQFVGAVNCYLFNSLTLYFYLWACPHPPLFSKGKLYRDPLPPSVVPFRH